MAARNAISRYQINQWLACSLRRAATRHGFGVLKSEVVDGSVRLDLDNGDTVIIDYEHVVARTGEP
jgi:hypothetical protein